MGLPILRSSPVVDKAARLAHPPKYLPAYSPDLNLIERLWLGLKTEFFANFIAKTNEDLIAQLINGLRHFLDSPATTARLCSLKTSL